MAYRAPTKAQIVTQVRGFFFFFPFLSRGTSESIPRLNPENSKNDNQKNLANDLNLDNFD